MKDHLVRVVSKDGLLRGVVADTTRLVQEITTAQQTDITATVALGRLVSGAAILGCLLKGSQRLALMMEGNGPLRKLSVEADANGRVRGTIVQPVAGLPPKDDRFDVAGAIGKAGFLHVWKDLGLKSPYQSMVQLQTSEVAEDIAWYLTSSEQVPSSLGLGVELDLQGAVACAGGFLIQALPPGDAGQVERLIERLNELPPVTTMLKEGMTPLVIAEKLFGEVDFVVQEETPLTFFCPCQQTQIETMLMSLGKEELTSLMKEQEVVEVTCEYCRKAYQFDREAMKTLISEVS